MTKTVTVDARWLVGGIGTYTRNLLREFSSQGKAFGVRAIVRKRDAESVREYCPDVRIVDQPIYTLSEQFLVPRASRDTDLLHVPHFNAPLLHRGPLVVSIMDVIHLRSAAYRGNLSTLCYARPMLHAAARMAERIVTVSEYSRGEIVGELGIPASKVTVIPCGVGAEFHTQAPTAELLEAVRVVGVQLPYVLYVGNLKPHKNVATLLCAFAALSVSRKIPHSLLIVGDDPRGKRPLAELVERLGIRNRVIFVPHVSQSLLPRLYAAADLLVMPSSVEGFGLPVIEAMASGTPVITSTAGSLPEVAGDAALFFDPGSPEELSAQLLKIATSPELRADLRARGLAQAERFSWSESARRHCAVYSELLGIGGNA